jgi:hypothetical protein
MGGRVSELLQISVGPRERGIDRRKGLFLALALRDIARDLRGARNPA